jgi:imidazolonepropionase-like amidohydrolase
VRSGLTPLEALRTATYNPAEFLGALDSLGTVAQGKVADLLLLDANPLADVRNTRRIAVVIANGRVFDQTARAQLLKDVKTTLKH